MRLTTAWAVVLAAALAAGAQAAARPNLIVILADDMGFSDLGCYGGEIETPNLDALAQNGLRFTQFYNAARCCPTRAALLTGLYPHQTGIGDMSGDDALPGYRGFLNDRCATLAEVLRPAGYTTLMAGKWHVGAEAEQWPTARGFDRYWGTPAGGGVYFKETLAIRKEVYFVQGDARVEFPAGRYVTDLFTEHAMAFIEEAVTVTRKPFFLYLAHIAPHWPLQAKAEDIAKYQGRYEVGWDVIRERRLERQKRLGIVSPETALSARDAQARAWDQVPADERQVLAHRMAVYAAQVDCIDQNVGKLVAKLKALGQFENTLIVFLSDNGCSSEGGPGGFSRGMAGAPIGTGSSYASAGLEWANACNAPLRKFKMNTHEGGVATPLIVHWPAGIAARGELRRQTGHVIDLIPTLLNVAGASYPTAVNGKAVQPLEGCSLVPAFTDQPVIREALYWEHEGHKAVRQGDWKAVSHERGAWELYDLSADRTETHDVASAHPEKVRALAALGQGWAARCGVMEMDDLRRHRQERKQQRRP